MKKRNQNNNQIYLNQGVFIKKDKDGRFYLRNARTNMIIGSQYGYKTIENAKNSYYGYRAKNDKKRRKVIIYRVRSCS